MSKVLWKESVFINATFSSHEIHASTFTDTIANVVTCSNRDNPTTPHRKKRPKSQLILP